MRYFVKKLEEDVRDLEAQVSSGNLKDFADYRYWCGVIRGLELASDRLLEAIIKQEKDENG
jgi:hypothetical protein